MFHTQWIRAIHTSPSIARIPKSLAAAQAKDLQRRLAKEAERRNPKHLVEACRLVKKTVKKHSSTSPSVDLQKEAYELLLDILAERGLSDDAMKVLEDIEASGVGLTSKAHELLVKAAAESENVTNMEYLLRHPGVAESSAGRNRSILTLGQWSPTAYQFAIDFCAKTSNLELALMLWFSALDSSVSLEEGALLALVECTYHAKEPRLAYEITRASENATPAVWMEALRVAAEYDYAPALEEAWSMLNSLRPDEGLFLQVLLVASRAGKDCLIDSMLADFAKLYPGTKIQQWHLIPVFDAYCQVGRINDAIAIVNRLMKMPIELDSKFLESLTAYAASSDENLAKSVHTLFQHKPKPPISVLNALLYAAAERGSMPTALRLWNTARHSKAFKLNLDTHNAFLLCCIAAGDRAAGQLVWDSVQQSGLTPTATLYERMARLHLTQPDYEEAFAFLEQVKHLGCVPSRRTYAAMIWTCLHYNDPRWKTLLQEMQEADYEPGDRLREALSAHEKLSP